MGYKLCKVVKQAKAKKASIGRNPFVSVNDTVKVSLATGNVIGHLKYDVGNLCFVKKGNNRGRIGTLTSTERHPGSYDIVHLKDRKGNAFSTRQDNVMVIGE